jgi:hypothetical protein
MFDLKYTTLGIQTLKIHKQTKKALETRGFSS